MAKTKKSAKRKQHPNIKKAVADIKKLQKAHKKMALELEGTMKTLRATPFFPMGPNCG